MATYQFLSLTGSNGLTTAMRVSATGANPRFAVESIGRGPASSAQMINRWLDAPADCRQLLDVTYTHVGAACVAPHNTDRGPYWSIVLSSSGRF